LQPQSDTKRLKLQKLNNADDKLELIIEHQTEELQRNRDHLKTCKPEDLKVLLAFNQYEVQTENNNELFDVCSDVVTFGIPEKCQKCHDGLMVFTGNGYSCTGWTNSWIKCKHFKQLPSRTKCLIPPKWKGKMCFQEIDCQLKNRVLRPFTPKPKFRLANSAKFEEFDQLLQKHSASVNPKLGEKIVICRDIRHCLYSFVVIREDNLGKWFFKLQLLFNAKDFYLSSCEGCIGGKERSDDSQLYPSIDSAVSSFKRIFKEKTGNDWEPTSKFKKAPGESQPLFQAPSSIFSDDKHPFMDSSKSYKLRNYSYYSCILVHVDIEKNINSFIKMQIDCGTLRMIYSSDRIGSESEVESVFFHSKDSAISEFMQVFQDKTGNDWNSNFEKVPDKYYLYDRSITFNKKLIDLKKFLFNTTFDSVCNNRLFPLGIMSREQLEEALMTLNELETGIKAGYSQNILQGLSNKFFTLMPQDFGQYRPPVLKTVQEISEQMKRINGALEIEENYEEFNQLDVKVELLSPCFNEYQMIETYLKNTSVHDFNLQILEVFKVTRHCETERYIQFNYSGNRMLLWHGSLTTNIPSIAKEGLKITQQSNGSMFGRGIYFADMVSKSANYCKVKSGESGFLILCEVALGMMFEVFQAQNFAKPPNGYGSIKGIGRTIPNVNGNRRIDDDVIIPMGKPVKFYDMNTSHRIKLNYNEYVVYSEDRIKIRYLVKFKKTEK
jgi:poly [ADP-ribose] polymerase 1